MPARARVLSRQDPAAAPTGLRAPQQTLPSDRRARDPAPAPAEAPAELETHLEGYCRDNSIRVETRDLAQDLYGYYQRAGDRIVLAASSTGGERAATLAHELTHREDPALIEAHRDGDDNYRHHRVDCEAVAEAAAHAISARFGFDITGRC